MGLETYIKHFKHNDFEGLFINISQVRWTALKDKSKTDKQNVLNIRILHNM